MTASGGGLVPTVPCSASPPCPRLEGGQGVMGARDECWRDSRAQGDGSSSLPARQTAGTKDVAVISPGTWKGQDVSPGWGSRVQPPWVSGRGEEQTEGQRASIRGAAGHEALFWVALPCAWPPCPLVAAGHSWWPQAGGPRLAWAGATPGRDGGRDEGAGCHEVPRQGHLIPPGASS